MDNNSIKDTIYRFRKAKGYTQEDMAARLGTSVTTYRSIESGKTNLIHPMVKKISEVLDISEEALLAGTEVAAPASLRTTECHTSPENRDAGMTRRRRKTMRLSLMLTRQKLTA